jgi:hypothetical protein
MPALPDNGDGSPALVTKTARSVAAVSDGVLRRALARLGIGGGDERGSGRRTR